MDYRSHPSYVFYFIVLLIFSTNLNLSEAENDVECKKAIIAVIRSTVLRKVGAELMKMNEDSGEGFVYSEMKTFQWLLAMYPLVSSSAQSGIKSFLQLAVTKCEVVGKALDEMINKRQEAHNVSQFEGAMFVNRFREHPDKLDSFLTDTFQIDFSDPSVVLSEINKEFRKYCEPHEQCFKMPIDPKTNFLLLNSVTVEPDLFSGESPFRDSEIPFTDLEGTEKRIVWVKTTGYVWEGTKTSLPGEKNLACKSVKLYGSKLEKDKAYMFYFKPEFTADDSKDTKLQCIQSIFKNLRVYTKATIYLIGQKTTKTYNSLAVPLMDILSEFDLKPILQNDIGGLFSEGQITGVYNTAETLHEWRSWGYINNRPSNASFIGKTPEEPVTADLYVSSPYVFTLMERKTKWVLKTGAMLRPNAIEYN